MKVNYIVEIKNPQNHMVNVTLNFVWPVEENILEVFLPSWSPGSYLLREYSRNVRWFSATQGNGEVLFFDQTAKGTWKIDRSKSTLKKKDQNLSIQYEIYCKELTVRTSHVDESHAFLHGPSYLMGVAGEEISPEIEFRFPPLWSKLTTALKDISKERSSFKYSAKNYDELIDTPVEIGCHETDGFMYKNKAHHLAHYGEIYPHKNDLKGDIKKVVETVAKHFDEDLPYEEYVFITHFVPKLFGGLEHLSSTALQFDGRKLANRKEYLNYLSLVGHEYFHLWNVKRIRPQELGPFDYLNENYTSLLWLAEGLTSFVDDLFVYRAGISTLEEYLSVVRDNFGAYFATPGRNYHSLEQSSFNAWIKLYRPDENSKNSSVSYYLKGGLVFAVLHSMLLENGSSINAFLKALWTDYKERPELGITREGVYDIVKKLGGQKTLEKFSTMVETTEDIDFESAFQKMGCEFIWEQSEAPSLGVDWEFQGDRAIVKAVTQDSVAYRSGLNAGDEVIFLNGLRFIKEDALSFSSLVLNDVPYEFIVSRLNKLQRIEFIPTRGQRNLKEIRIINREVAEKAFKL